MSHYTVAVFHRKDQDIDELLAPYDENLKVERYVRYTKAEAIAYVRANWNETDNMSDEECWQAMADDYDNNTDDDGNIYTTYNLNAKWDWWVIGGRFSDILTLKNGDLTDSAQVKDLDFSLDKEAYQRALRFWDIIVDRKPLKSLIIVNIMVIERLMQDTVRISQPMQLSHRTVSGTGKVRWVGLRVPVKQRTKRRIGKNIIRSAS